MKLQLFAVLVIVAGAYALPRANVVPIVAESSNEAIQRSFIEDLIRNAIERVSRIIQSVGLDPLVVEREEIEIGAGVLNFAIKGFVENLRFNGASDIHIHSLSYSHLFNRLRLDVSLPEISLAVGDSSLEYLIFGREFEGQFKGSVSVKSVRLACELHVNVGIGGISLRSLSVDFSLGGIESDVKLVVRGDDISENVNNLLGNRIPLFVEDNKDEINQRLEDAISDIFNRMWNSEE